MKRFQEILKKQDAFGYQFFLKFTRKEDVYKTVVGGLAASVMNLIILGLFCWQLQIMTSKKQFQIYSDESDLDFSNFEPKKLIELENLFYMQIQYTVDKPINKTYVLNNLFQYSEQSVQFQTSVPTICTRSQFEKVNSGKIFDSYDQTKTILMCFDSTQNLISGPLPVNLLNSDQIDQNGISIRLSECGNSTNCVNQTEFEQNTDKLYFIFHSIEKQITTKIKEGPPLRYVDRAINVFKLNTVFHNVNWLVLKKNVLKCTSLLNFLGKDQDYVFYTIDKVNSLSQNVITSNDYPYQNLFSVNIGLYNQKSEITITYYGIFDVFAWIGGIQINIYALFQIIIGAYALHHLIINIIQNSFYVVDQVQSNQDNKDKYQMQKNIRQKIKFTRFQHWQLYFFQNIKIFVKCFKLSFYKSPLYKTYKKGKIEISEQTKLLKVLKLLRFLELYHDNNLNKNEMKNLKSVEENIINHDQNLPSSSSDEIQYNINYGSDQEALQISQIQHQNFIANSNSNLAIKNKILAQQNELDPESSQKQIFEKSSGQIDCEQNQESSIITISKVIISTREKYQDNIYKNQIVQIQEGNNEENLQLQTENILESHENLDVSQKQIIKIAKQKHF